ncbi:MAG: PIN domain-containing protein, partial [Alphaproteobacteria bacterium]
MNSAEFSPVSPSRNQFFQNPCIKVINVDLSADIDGVLNDYFDMKPPFSSKKQSEFPDAIVLSSLENWCKSWRKLYIVSGDPDFENFCSNSKNLIHINSLPDFITKALVSKEFQEKLYKFFENN